MSLVRRGATIAASLCVLLAGCGSGSPETSIPDGPGISLQLRDEAGAPRGAVPDPSSVDTDLADDVADAVAASALVVDTRVDPTPTAGLRRAARWLATGSVDVVAPASASAAQGWRRLSGADGYTTASVARSARAPAVVEDGIVLSRRAVLAVHDGAGRVLDTVDLAVLVTVSREAVGGWRVTSVSA